MWKEGIRIIYTNADKLRVRKMRLKLVTFSANDCTMGKLWHGDELLCCTIERPDLDNKPFVSCVPAGLYKLNPTISPKFGDTYYIENKELGVSLNDGTQRTHILLHIANKASELHGCIAPVSYFGVLGDERAGLASETAYNKLMVLLNREQHELEIIRN